MSQTILSPTVEAEAASPDEPRPTRSFGSQAFAFFSSFGLVCAILCYLMALTFRGTYEQVDIGTVAAQAKYFDSWWWRYPLGSGGLFIPVPGAQPMLWLLAINLICGGLIKIKWSTRIAGILITHVGILLLLISGIVTYHMMEKGSMMLWEEPSEDRGIRQAFPEQTALARANVARDFNKWEIAIGERRGDGSFREYLIADDQLRPGAEFRHAALPFHIVVRHRVDNCVPVASRTRGAADAAEGVTFRPPFTPPVGLPPRAAEQQKLQSEKEKRLAAPGLIVDAVIPSVGSKHGVLWGSQDYPWTVRVGDVPYTIHLRRKIYDLPFELRLDEFDVEFHPGTSRPRLFRSNITRLEPGSDGGPKYEIVMNQPMRYKGYTFSQNSWGPDDPRQRPGAPGQSGKRAPRYTVLEVTTNPADQWPKYCTYVIALGLLIHFLRKLILHVERQTKRRVA